MSCEVVHVCRASSEGKDKSDMYSTGRLFGDILQRSCGTTGVSNLRARTCVLNLLIRSFFVAFYKTGWQESCLKSIVLAAIYVKKLRRTKVRYLICVCKVGQLGIGPLAAERGGKHHEGLPAYGPVAPLLHFKVPA